MLWREVVNRRCLRPDGVTELLCCEASRVADIDDMGAGDGEDVVVLLAAVRLHQHFVGDAVGVGQALQVVAVVERQAGGDRERERCRGAGGHVGSLSVEHLGDDAAAALEKLLHIDEAVVCGVHCGAHGGGEDGAAEDGVGAAGVDQGPDAEGGVQGFGLGEELRLLRSHGDSTGRRAMTTLRICADFVIKFCRDLVM